MKIDVFFAPHFSNLHDENVDLVSSGFIIAEGNAFKSSESADTATMRW